MGNIWDLLSGRDFNELSESEKIDIEWAMWNRDTEFLMLCVMCLVPIESGNTCEVHKGMKPNW